MSCVPCAERKLGSKWGRCAFCTAIALGGAVTGWSLTLSLAMANLDRRMPMMTGGVAAFFTLVLFVHFAAFVWHRRKSPAAPAPA